MWSFFHQYYSIEHLENGDYDGVRKRPPPTLNIAVILSSQLQFFAWNHYTFFHGSSNTWKCVFRLLGVRARPFFRFSNLLAWCSNSKCSTCTFKTKKKTKYCWKPKKKKKTERTACLLFELLVFVKNNFGVFFFACLVFELTGVRATVEKRVLYTITPKT